jgi:hypothetical protein
MTFLLFLSSCLTSDDGGESDRQEVELTFSLKVEQSVSSVVAMRSSSYTDSSIRCIDLLVFDEAGKFMQRIAVNGIEGSESSPTFTVRLPASSTSRTIHVIANGRNQENADLVNFNDISVGMTEDAVASSLKTISPLSSYTSPELPLIMWGKKVLSGIARGAETGTIHLIRQVAAMRVEYVASTSDNGVNDFILKGFSLQQSAAVGKVIPNDHSSSDVVPTSVSVLSETPAYIDYINPNPSPNGSGVWYYVASDINPNVTADAYLYERNNVLDNTGLSVIVHGAYKRTDDYYYTDGYYKVWLKKDGAVNPVRNHLYRIQITRVSGPGYPTLQEALAANYSANISVDITDDNEDITYIIADSRYKLGVSAEKVLLAISEGEMTICSVLSTNPALTLSVANISMDANASAWITNLTLTRSTSDNTRYTLKGTLASITSNRSGKITVRAGSLTLTFTVIQNVLYY